MPLFFELIQVSLGNRETLSHVPTADEWQQLYDMAERQAILGICFVGVSRLHELSEINANANSVEFSVESVESPTLTPNPTTLTKNLPRKLFIRWAGRAAIIQERNEKLDRYCDTLTAQFREAGFDTCILKGQGVAQLYKYVNANHGPSMVACSEVPPLNSPSSLTSNPNNPASSIDSVELKFQHPASNSASCILHSASNPASCILHSASNNDFDLSQYRQPGDIDIWMWPRGEWQMPLKERRKKVVSYLRLIGECDQPTYHHTDVKLGTDIPVEAHYTPLWMYSPFTNRRLQRWFDSMAPTEMQNQFSTIEFNRVFILVHIFRHFLYEGIGLRQLIDYYFVLRSYQQTLTPNHSTLTLLQSLKLEKFASALLWVINEVCIGTNPNQNNPASCIGSAELSFDSVELKFLHPASNEPEGRFLLSEIMQAGNFGHADSRMKMKSGDSRFSIFLKHVSRNFHFLAHYPSEVLWSPLWKLWHFFWRIKQR